MTAALLAGGPGPGGEQAVRRKKKRVAESAEAERKQLHLNKWEKVGRRDTSTPTAAVSGSLQCH